MEHHLKKGDLREALMALAEASPETLPGLLADVRQWAREERASDRLHKASEALKSAAMSRDIAAEEHATGGPIGPLVAAELAFDKARSEYSAACSAYDALARG
jgi:hypothetical protein